MMALDQNSQIGAQGFFKNRILKYPLSFVGGEAKVWAKMNCLKMFGQ